MNIKLPLLLSVLCLAACAPFSTSQYGTLPPPARSVWQLSADHQKHVEDITREAGRLAIQVGAGDITKVQAAQLLNQFRLKTVGRNVVDDNVYDIYFRSAVDSHAGKISGAQSKQQIKNALSTWQSAWSSMGDNRPADPAFTNFLMKTMGMTPLR